MPRIRLALLVCALLGSTASLVAKDFDWPQWRGPDRSGVSKETGLLASWPENGPAIEWTTTGLGGGFSSPSIADGKIFVMTYLGSDEAVVAMDEATGKILWKKAIGPKGNVSYNQGPRSTPTVDGGMVYVVGVNGTLTCLKTADGSIVWAKNYQNDFGGRMMSGWGYSESVLIDGEKLYCTPGGDNAAIVALNKKTGKPIWAARVPNGGGAGYSSPVTATVGRTKMVINWLGSALVGVNAATGKLLWTYDKNHNGTANIPTPIVKGDLVFASTGYGAGSALLKLVPDNRGGVTAKEQYFLRASDLQNHHGGMVLVGDYVFCGHGHNAGAPSCVELKTGKIVWREDRGPGSGSAAVTYADGKLIFRYQNGVIALISGKTDDYELISKFRQPNYSGAEAWAHPVVANGKMYIMDQDKLICFQLKAN
ncbi:PQQ-binding-like beta-propeller repeat protein [Tuwongella immobilis]|uniref:Pyrrolo-quinoline quinone repeat domain-containing protein n=1 Tax=Tuwongella immobilis TaxID=692036 RepID=A0A6C2YK20_9BACT|nr:PQQ-binding-like beta-propeller repeat protein [Tuwongella immobilis]VIP01455.1 Uncharacterized protein OS=Pirellula staleyi (strain ATCC 27377 / DSM 6068 / ICPB 4128) GN=Psta_3389 PE=4 SV=1: PQQ_2 [Tuwongella immobilis]VTR98457.1 Uncharacterized protein OS=Pirellula staleyi (strain ATCC 27377 / DSM 6068 / ICPB 4128) GN=Psta_3389 PE=4 SV=1: PQQ_2 [Tuwongella immobilis]